jgi:hypothetical protein
MPMFGYKLKLVKESDLYEMDVFEKVVPSLRDQVSQFRTWIHEEVRLNEGFVQQLSIDIEGLGSLTEIYARNKYSSPVNSCLLLDCMNKIRKCGSHIVDVVLMAQQLEATKRMADAADEAGEEYDSEEFGSGVNQAEKMIGQQMYTLMTSLDQYLRLIQLNIENDVILIGMGTNAIREREKTYCKNGKKKSEFMYDVGIRFAKLTKEELLKQEKECNKDEQ